MSEVRTTDLDIARSYLADAEKSLDLAARGDMFQIAVARYKVIEAYKLLSNRAKS